ncbi:hypothetical protein [Nocardia pneumoniae]|uniref:hypothetical protein n=1 Tax=Nocardia pneumoniae TaxID=228601 RepID=UPI0005937AF0|nr:hypothetical protein [Nocardia pneumoniae]
MPERVFEHSDEFADALNLLIADAVWAVTNNGDTGPAADLVAALDRGCADPLVSKAAALALSTVELRSWKLTPVHRALVRVARAAWRAWPNRSDLVQELRRRAEVAHEDDNSLVAADLYAIAVELCDVRPDQDRAGALPLVADLLGDLVEVLSETGGDGPAEVAELMSRGAAAARWRIGILRELARTDRARYLPWLADARMAAVEFVAWVDGRAAGVDQSERGMHLYQELFDSAGIAVLPRLAHAWSKHIAMLDRVGDEGAADRWKRRRDDTLRGLVSTVADIGSSRELATLIRMLRVRDMHAEVVVVSTRAVSLAETTADDQAGAATVRLAETLRQHGEYLHHVGQRTEAVRSWHRFIEVRQRVRDSSVGVVTAVADDYRAVVALAKKLGDRSAAVEFGEGAVTELSRLAELNRSEHLAPLVDELRAQAQRLRVADRSAEASDMAERALAQARTLVAMDPQRYRPNLSWALTCATRMHLDSWRMAEADRRSGEAVELIEQLAREEPDSYTAALAGALQNRTVALNHRRDYAQSRETSERAVELYEGLAVNNAKHRASLANVLCTRALILSHLREFDAALVCAVRAVDLYSQLAERNPRTYLPELAYALNNVASIHEDMGNTDAVRSTATRVLEICETLQQGSIRDLRQASALHVLVRTLTRIGDMAGALAYSTPLLQIRERMAARDPAAEESELAVALGNHALCLGGCGRHREALEYTRRALELWRRLSESEPYAYQKRLVGALDRHATGLWATSRSEEALEVSTEAVERYEQLLADDRDLYLNAAAMCVNNHALRLDSVGRAEEAVATGLRGLAMAEELVARDARAYRRHLGTSLINHAVRLLDLDNGAEALQYTTRAVALFEELTPDGAAHARSLARALHHHARALERVDRQAEAVSAAEKAVRIVESQAAEDRRSNLTILANTTHGLAVRLVNAGQWPRGRERSRAGVRLWQELADSDSELHLPDCAAVLEYHARFCRDKNEWSEAAAYFERAAAALEELTARDPARHRRDWAHAVESHAHARYRLGEGGRASAEVDRALSIRRDAVAESPEENMPWLAAGEGWAARFRLYLGETNLARAHLERSVAHYRALIDAGRDVLAPELVSVHHRYATSLCENGFRTQASIAMSEAVRLTLHLVATDRAAHRSALAEALRDQAWLLAEAGRRYGSVAAGRAALSLLQEIIGEGESDHRWRLADYLDSLADSLAEVARYTEALELSDRALPIWEELATEEGELSTDLAWSLWHRARWRTALDESDFSVLSLSQRAVEIYQQTSETRPGDQKYLAGALVDHARHLALAGRHPEAVDHSSRALGLWEVLSTDQPRVHRPGLADCLRWHATHLAQLDEQDTALECAWRAVELADEAAQRTPLRYRPDLAAICGATARLLHDRKPDEARELAARSVSLYTRSAAEQPGLFGPQLREVQAMVSQWDSRG